MTMNSSTTSCVLLALIGCVIAQLSHPKPWEVARKDRVKRIICNVDQAHSSATIFWYRARLGEAMQHIKDGNSATLTLTSVSDKDAATYYCALWTGDQKVFSSGVRIYTDDKRIKAPTVSVYSVSKPHLNALLCQARDMFPDWVKFKWQAKDKSGKTVELKDEEQLEQRQEDQEVQITSMLIVNLQRVKSSTFICSVTHSSETTHEIDLQQDEQNPDPDSSKRCPTPKEKTHKPEEKKEELEEEETEENPVDGVLEFRRSLYLFSVTYSTLLVKNIIYFFTVCILLYKKKSANK